jgi:hypothetical protein
MVRLQLSTLSVKDAEIKEKEFLIEQHRLTLAERDAVVEKMMI